MYMCETMKIQKKKNESVVKLQDNFKKHKLWLNWELLALKKKCYLKHGIQPKSNQIKDWGQAVNINIEKGIFRSVAFFLGGILDLQKWFPRIPLTANKQPHCQGETQGRNRSQIGRGKITFPGLLVGGPGTRPPPPGKGGGGGWSQPQAPPQTSHWAFNHPIESRPCLL